MVKTHTTLSIENETIETAKRHGVNMSECAEKAIEKACGLIKETIDTTKNKCEFCDREFEKQTADGDNPNGLTWLWPDEKWICESCLSHFSRHTPIVQK